MSVLVILQQTGARWHPASWEALAAGIQIGADLGIGVAAAVAGQRAGELAAEAAGKKVDRVYALEHELLESYSADGYTRALEELIRSVRPAVVVFPHTYEVRDYAPKLATRFGQVLVGDVIRHRADGDALVLTRQLFQGKLLADIRTAGPPPRFVSVQAGAYRADHLEVGSAEVEKRVPNLIPEAVRTHSEEPFREAQDTVDLTVADCIVAAGRGIQEEADISLIEELAEELGAEVAASRPICDNGWLPIERQVGSSGQTVAPKLYIAIGVSGAIQHLVGMKGSKTIVAINKDPEAPIFEVADYGIAGDLYDVVPALIEELKKTK